MSQPLVGGEHQAAFGHHQNRNRREQDPPS
jgi:hypothetical protein